VQVRRRGGDRQWAGEGNLRCGGTALRGRTAPSGGECGEQGSLVSPRAGRRAHARCGGAVAGCRTDARRVLSGSDRGPLGGKRLRG
jgi:hypothetical protein